MNWQEFLKDYLSFTRKERIGILILTGLIVIVALLPEVVSVKLGRLNSNPDTTWFSEVKKLEIKIDDAPEDNASGEEESNYQFEPSKGSYYANQYAKTELFYFDPNTLPADGWKKLGLRNRTIQTIQNYLAKGGHFNKPEDLQKIYGLHKDEYSRLVPFIKIELKPESKELVSTFAKSTEPATVISKYPARYSAIEINTADTTAFIALPGIGSKLAARIVNFRDKLGGFYSVEQIAETFGLPDSTFQKLKPYLKLENMVLKKININTATVDELKAHPYIKFSLANPIVAYRNEHGPFSKIEDIKKVMAVSEEIYQKISPYLTIE